MGQRKLETFIGKCLLFWRQCLESSLLMQLNMNCWQTPFLFSTFMTVTFLCFVTLWALLAACFMLVSFLASSSTLKTEVLCSSKMSIDFHQTIYHYIPKDKSSLNCLLLLLWYRGKSKVSSVNDRFITNFCFFYPCITPRQCKADLLVMNISVTWMLIHIHINHYLETTHNDGAYCPWDSAECSVAEWYLTFLWKCLLLPLLAAIKSIYLQSGRQSQHSNKKSFSFLLCFIIGITIVYLSMITHSKYTIFWPKLHNASTTGSRT